MDTSRYNESMVKDDGFKPLKTGILVPRELVPEPIQVGFTGTAERLQVLRDAAITQGTEDQRSQA